MTSLTLDSKLEIKMPSRDVLPTDDKVLRAWFSLFMSVAAGVALRAELTLNYSRWLALATGTIIAYSIQHWPMLLSDGAETSLGLGAFSALASLLFAAIVYRKAMALLPLGKMLQAGKAVFDAFGPQDQAALDMVTKKFVADVNETGFLGELVRAIGEQDFEHASKLANRRVRWLEGFATCQFTLVVASVAFVQSWPRLF